jgi:transposase
MRLLEALPEAVAVFDAFQADSHLNKATDTPRREQHGRLRRSADDTRKGTKYHSLRSCADPGGQKAQDFHRPLQQDLQKARACALKENFRRIWSYRSVTGAMRFAHDWAGAVANSGLRLMITTAETVKRPLSGIAGSVTHPITTAAGEGAHSKN